LYSKFWGLIHNSYIYKAVALFLMEDERLPAIYANFLIINDAVLLPFYHSPPDETARQRLQEAFPDREIIGIDCRPLIKQHGSLHCVTMQLPAGFVAIGSVTLYKGNNNTPSKNVNALNKNNNIFFVL
jgi:hypothetical protein